MANEKIFQSRIQLKHDIEENWLKAINFVPKEGEIIIYDSDSNNPTPRFKIGDGVTVIGSLPFVAAQADWNITDESDSGYIKNKPEEFDADDALEYLISKNIITPLASSSGKVYTTSTGKILLL